MPSTSTARSAPDLDLTSCLACGATCEITGRFALADAQGDETYVRTRCVLGHLMLGPEFALRAAA